MDRSAQSDAMVLHGGLSRTVSFPNFFRGLLDYHRIEDGADHSLFDFGSAAELAAQSVNYGGDVGVNSYVAMTTPPPQSPLLTSPPPQSPLTPTSTSSHWLLQPAQITAGNDSSQRVKLSRCDTWAGGFTVAAVDDRVNNNATAQKSNCGPQIRDESTLANADKSTKPPVAMTAGSLSDSNRTVVPALPAAILPKVEKLMPSAAQNQSKILSAFVNQHDKSVVHAVPQTGKFPAVETGDIFVSTAGQQGRVNPMVSANNRQQHVAQIERKGLFGLPGRVRVSQREINMMSPTSF